jgi:Arc/MetJ-type ribon-helix-helix transcriptional regulator
VILGCKGAAGREHPAASLAKESSAQLEISGLSDRKPKTLKASTAGYRAGRVALIPLPMFDSAGPECITTCVLQINLHMKGDAMPVIVRLDRQTEVLVQRISRSTGRSKSDVIRDAIRRLADEDSVKPAESVYEQIADVVGVARGGRRRYAARSEEVLRRLFPGRRRGQ